MTWPSEFPCAHYKRPRINATHGKNACDGGNSGSRRTVRRAPYDGCRPRATLTEQTFAHTKRYLDYWSGWLTVPGSGFQERMTGRTLWGVSAMADRDESVGEGLVTTLHHSAAYLRMGFGGVLFGNGSRPGQVRDDEQAMLRARTFFRGETPLARFPYEEKVVAGR